jgi:hypothetical protein
MIRRLAIPLSLCCGLAVCPLAIAQSAFPSTTAVISQPSSSIFGQPVAFSATVTAHGGTVNPVPTGNVTFTNGANTLGTATLDTNGVAILTGVTTLPAGQPIITATYSGDKVVQPSFGTITQTVAAATPNITWVPNPDSIAVGAPLTAAQLDATASTKFTPNVPGTFIYKPAAGTVFNTPGPQTLTVAFTPTDAADFLPSASRAQINVIAQPSKTAVISQPSPSIFGQPITFSATVTANIAFAKVAINPAANPTGTVTFMNGATLLGTATLNANTAVLTGVTLPAGQFIIDAIYSGDGNFSGSKGSIPQTVTQAPTNIAWNPNPATLVVGALLTAAQLDATASTKFTPNVPGTFTYKPAAGTVFNTPGPQTLTVAFTPTDAANFLPSVGNAQINVVAFTLASINPSTATLGDPAKPVTLTGTGFDVNSVAEVNGNPIPTQFVNGTTLTATIPPTAFATASTLQLTVADPQFQLVTNALPLPVTVPPLQVVLTGPPTSPPATDTSITFALTTPYPAPLSGVLTLTFTPAPGLTDDPMIGFDNGTRTLTFSIPANSTTTPPVQFQAGTVTGSVTIALTVTAGGVNVTPDGLQPVIVQLPPAPPVLTSTTMLQRSGRQLTVVIHGFSNTRELSTANFDFTAASGSIKNPNIALPVTTLFTQWYSSQPSDQFGSAFTYTQSFILNDDASHITSVSVTLVNSIGTSTPGSAQ